MQGRHPFSGLAFGRTVPAKSLGMTAGEALADPGITGICRWRFLLAIYPEK
jgi:hypothetical protein